MCKKTITIMILTICVGISFAAENGGDDIAYELKKVGDNYVSVEEYWVIKSQALTELIPFLTRTRSEAKGHYKALTDYIKHIGKGRDFLDSGITGPSSPAEYARVTGKAEEFEKNNVKLPEKWMTWDQLAELAMEFVVNEGYAPTDVNGPEEIEMFKQICDRKEKYGKKVQTDLRKILQDCLDMKAYLDSINKFGACVKYTRYQKEQKAQARKEELEIRRKERVAAKRSSREETQKYARDARRDRAIEDRAWQERQRRFGNLYHRGGYGRRSYY